MQPSTVAECWEATPDERTALIAQLRTALANERRVRVAFLFGSFAKQQPFRDLDVGVMLDEPFNAMDVASLATRLWLAAGRPEFEIDVVPLSDAPPAFRLEAASGVPLREAWPGAASDFSVDALSEKIDFKAGVASIAGAA